MGPGPARGVQSADVQTIALRWGTRVSRVCHGAVNADTQAVGRGAGRHRWALEVGGGLWERSERGEMGNKEMVFFSTPGGAAGAESSFSTQSANQGLPVMFSQPPPQARLCEGYFQTPSVSGEAARPALRAQFHAGTPAQWGGGERPAWGEGRVRCRR